MTTQYDMILKIARILVRQGYSAERALEAARTLIMPKEE